MIWENDRSALRNGSDSSLNTRLQTCVWSLRNACCRDLSRWSLSRGLWMLNTIPSVTDKVNTVSSRERRSIWLDFLPFDMVCGFHIGFLQHLNPQCWMYRAKLVQQVLHRRKLVRRYGQEEMTLNRRISPTISWMEARQMFMETSSHGLFQQPQSGVSAPKRSWHMFQRRSLVAQYSFDTCQRNDYRDNGHNESKCHCGFVQKRDKRHKTRTVLRA